MLRATGRSAVLVSEEDEEAIVIESCERGYYCLAFDPLVFRALTKACRMEAVTLTAAYLLGQFLVYGIKKMKAEKARSLIS